MATVPAAEPGLSVAFSARDALLTPDSLAPIPGIGIVIPVPTVEVCAICERLDRDAGERAIRDPRHRR
ncbi:hypothetical protein D3C78_1695600 [compost metagenome]